MRSTRNARPKNSPSYDAGPLEFLVAAKYLSVTLYIDRTIIASGALLYRPVRIGLRSSYVASRGSNRGYLGL